MRLRSVLSIAGTALMLTAGCANKPNDATLVTNIKAQMFSDAQLKGANLQVASSHGEVTLSGTVPTDAARLDAYKIAAQTPGVSKVNDQMMVDNSQTAQAENVQSSPAPAQQAPPENQPTEEAKPTAPPARAAKRERRHIERAEKAAANASEADQTQTAAPAESQPVTPSATQDQVAQAPPAVATPAPAVAPLPVPPPPPPPRQVVVPADTTVSIRMIDGVDSSVNKTGEIFHASLDAPVVVDNEVAVPRGADVYVRLASASSSGHMTGRSELHLELVKLEFQGQSYPVQSGTYSLAGASRGKDTAKKVGAGAVLGTLIGAIAGGGKGAAIGAAAGAGAGGVYQASTHGKQVKVPSETKLDFQLEQPVTITVFPRAATTGQ